MVLDKGDPFVSTNGPLDWLHKTHPLLSLAGKERFVQESYGYMSERIHYLLKHGANANMRDKLGCNCLHIIFRSSPIHNANISYYMVGRKDALMCLVTAGADIDAVNIFGQSVSELACRHGFEDLWIEVLSECGYDPGPFLQYLDHHYRRENTGFGAFTVMAPKVRSTRLSFAEYGKQRKSLPIHTPAEGNEDFQARRKRKHEWKEFLKLVEEESEDEEGDGFDGEVDIYSTEHGAEWLL
jgi:hypothetical protein